jgi:cruciform cutting endonuclease 1
MRATIALRAPKVRWPSGGIWAPDSKKGDFTITPGFPLNTLKNSVLQHLALHCGTPVSGTKDGLVRGIFDGLGDISGKPFKLISIDMGIRNLAYCCISSQETDNLEISAWKRLDLTGEAHEHLASNEATSPAPGSGSGLFKDKAAIAFDPLTTSSRAYDLINKIMTQHKPTNLIIERQRFRSGGASAVTEWTLRVGTFEYALHATLHTLKRLDMHDLAVESALPASVNRYWVARQETQADGVTAKLEPKPSGSAMKAWKIALVQQILQDNGYQEMKLRFHGQAEELKGDVLRLCQRRGRGKGGAVASKSLPKLDDVSDSLLQGLAWISWQENRRKLHAVLEALEEGRGTSLACQLGEQGLF